MATALFTVVEPLGAERVVEMPNAVWDESRGHYAVSTEGGGRYLLNLDERTVRRVVTAGHPLESVMRRDQESVRLLSVVRCEIGQPMVLLIDLAIPQVLMTTRETSVVLRIEDAFARGELVGHGARVR
jgi:hypothetical protein